MILSQSAPMSDQIQPDQQVSDHTSTDKHRGNIINITQNAIRDFQKPLEASPGEWDIYFSSTADGRIATGWRTGSLTSLQYLNDISAMPPALAEFLKILTEEAHTSAKTMPLRISSKNSESDVGADVSEQSAPISQESERQASSDSVVKEPPPKRFNEYGAEQTVYLHEIESVLEDRFGQWHQCVMSNLVNLFHLKTKDLPQEQKDDIGRKPHDRSRRAKYLVWLLVMPRRKPELAEKILDSVQKRSWSELWMDIVNEARLTKWDDTKEDEAENDVSEEVINDSEATPANERRKVLKNIINDVVPRLTEQDYLQVELVGMPETILRYRKQRQSGGNSRNTSEKKKTASSASQPNQKSVTDFKASERSGIAKVTKPPHKSKEPRRLAKKATESSLSSSHNQVLEAVKNQETDVRILDPPSISPGDISLQATVYSHPETQYWANSAPTGATLQVENLTQVHGNPRWTTLSGAWDAETDMRPNIQTFVEYPRAPDWQAHDGMPFPMRRTNSTSFWAPVAADALESPDEIINHVYVPHRFMTPSANTGMFQNISLHGDAVMQDMSLIQAAAPMPEPVPQPLASSTADYHQLTQNQFIYENSAEMHNMQDIQSISHHGVHTL